MFCIFVTFSLNYFSIKILWLKNCINMIRFSTEVLDVKPWLKTQHWIYSCIVVTTEFPYADHELHEDATGLTLGWWWWPCLKILSVFLEIAFLKLRYIEIYQLFIFTVNTINIEPIYLSFIKVRTKAVLKLAEICSFNNDKSKQ